MILVTGGTGLVGSHLLTELVKRNLPVRAIYRSAIPPLGENIEKQIEWVKADILDISALEEVMEGVDEIFHCAAVISFRPSAYTKMQRINVEGTANVVNAAIATGVRKLLYVSSVAALGKHRGDTLINETMNWTPKSSSSVYGKTKYLAEMEVWRGIGEGLDAVIVNPTIIFGEGDWNKGSLGIFKTVYNEFPWYSQGVTGFVDVKDVVNAMILLMKSDISGQRFIICGEHCTYQELFNMIADSFGKRRPHKKVTPFIAAAVWRWEALKSFFTGKDPLVTKETAGTALQVVRFDNSKLLQAIPDFSYTPLSQTIRRVAGSFTSS